MILGHSHPEVVAAIREAAGRGTSYGAPTALEIGMAERLVSAFPSIEMVRMVSSGTEATMTAIRLARGWTGRDKIVKFTGCYHGHADSLLVKAGSGVATLGIPGSPGIPRCLAELTIPLPYNDADAVRDAFARYGEEIACIIVEPVAGNMGVVPPRPGFLETLREVTHASGALLIFDEVITGFRLAYGGWQTLTGIVPDLTCLGKIIGGGLPVGALGGRREIMEHLAPTGPVYQAGTLSGNPLAMSAGIATLDILRGESYRRSNGGPRTSAPGSWTFSGKRGSPSGSTASGPCSPSSSRRTRWWTLIPPRGAIRPCLPASSGECWRRGSTSPRPVRGRLRLLRPHGRGDRPDRRCLRKVLKTL